MRTDQLRRVLRRIVHASLPAGVIALGCAGDTGIERAVRLRADSKPYDALVDRCRASDDDCLALCHHILDAEGEGIDQLHVSECRMHQLAPMWVEVEMTYDYPQACGRRPAGLASAAPGAVGVGAYLARCAELERASVTAFLQLAGELDALGAPLELVAAARRAAGDEVRHAALMAALARRAGAAPLAPIIAAPAPRAPVELALENAVEGCVREAYGAVVATYQASAAAPAIAAAMARIAPDETRHAALSLAVDRFLARLLDRGARRRVAEARSEALDQLAGDLDHEIEPAARAVLGLPDPGRARALLARAGEALAAG